MSIRDWLNEYADHNDMPLLTADGLDDAIIGICHRFNQSFVVYDQAKVIEILAREMVDGCEPDDDPEEMAWDHFGFNVIGGWVGEYTPGFIEYPPGAEGGDE